MFFNCYFLFSPSFIEILLTYNIYKFKVYSVMTRCIFILITVRLVNTFIFSRNYDFLCVCVW